VSHTLHPTLPCSPALGKATWRTQSEERVDSPLLKEIHAKGRRVGAKIFSLFNIFQISQRFIISTL